MRTVEEADGWHGATGPVDHRAQAVKFVRLARYEARSNIQCTVPDGASPLVTMSGPFASTDRI